MADPGDPRVGPPHQSRRRVREHRLTLLTRTHCHLCDVAHEVLVRVAADAGVLLEVHDVDGDPALAAKYGDRVPVTLLDGREHASLRVAEERLRRDLRR